jgi:CDP-6-deoxy-D-xylo-4-hexulose-3-dehydrase
VQREAEGTRHVWFGYPLTVSPDAPFTRKQIVDFLEEKGVETRPIMAGNFADQPVMRHLPYRKVGDLPHSTLVMRNAFLFGNHSGIGEEERETVLNHIRSFVRQTCGANR